MIRIRTVSAMLATLISLTNSSAVLADALGVSEANVQESLSLPSFANAASGIDQSANAEALRSQVLRRTEKKPLPLPKASPKKSVKVPQGHQYFVCFTGPGQVSAGDIKENKEAIALGEPGTIFSSSDKGVNLQTGCLLIGTRNNPLFINAGESKIDVQPNSSVMVDLSDSHAVECINGSASLTRSDGSISQALAHQQVSMNLPAPAQPVFKDPFFKEVTRSKFLLSATRDTTETNKANLHSLHANLLAASTAEAKHGQEPARIFPSTGAVFGLVRPYLMQITEGSMLVDLPFGCAIQTPFGLIQGTKRASIALQLSPASLFAGNCTIAATMVLKSNGHSFPEHVGRSVMVVSGIAVPGATITDGIARRRLHAYCDGCITGITADFSVLSFVQGCRSLRLAIMQPISKRETSFGGSFLKSMAALYTVTASYGSYYATPEIPKHTQVGEFVPPPEVVKLLAQNVQ
ncbi:MAG: hypothetical protein JST89_25840 [Cyanobacteria bacterium SZAS-4]|nr:hypothetical protein [Cyanobacteria bacterium SZAS-4]